MLKNQRNILSVANMNKNTCIIQIGPLQIIGGSLMEIK